MFRLDRRGLLPENAGNIKTDVGTFMKTPAFYILQQSARTYVLFLAKETRITRNRLTGDLQSNAVLMYAVEDGSLVHMWAMNRFRRLVDVFQTPAMLKENEQKFIPSTLLDMYMTMEGCVIYELAHYSDAFNVLILPREADQFDKQALFYAGFITEFKHYRVSRHRRGAMASRDLLPIQAEITTAKSAVDNVINSQQHKSVFEWYDAASKFQTLIREYNDLADRLSAHREQAADSILLHTIVSETKTNVNNTESENLLLVELERVEGELRDASDAVERLHNARESEKND